MFTNVHGIFIYPKEKKLHCVNVILDQSPYTTMRMQTSWTHTVNQPHFTNEKKKTTPSPTTRHARKNAKQNKTIHKYRMTRIRYIRHSFLIISARKPPRKLKYLMFPFLCLFFTISFVARCHCTFFFCQCYVFLLCDRFLPSWHSKHPHPSIIISTVFSTSTDCPLISMWYTYNLPKKPL